MVAQLMRWGRTNLMDTRLKLSSQMGNWMLDPVEGGEQQSIAQTSQVREFQVV
jgi:hypothetical protein